MRVADYIAQFVQKDLHCRNVFLVTGGGMMFLSDGVACCPGLKAVCTHHEQAAAMAAVGYAKYTGDFGCAMVTTGCGGTNAMTGLLNAWQDGAKVFFISGQVKRRQTIRNSGLPLRQFGVQEADIVGLVSPICKYAVMINEPEDIAFHLEKAKYLAQDGHPGPVWIDVPMDVQGAEIQPEKLRHFAAPEPEKKDLADSLAYLERALKQAKRPVILAGQGIDQSHTREAFYRLLEQWQIPVVTSFLGGNSIAGTHPCYIGRIGTKGNRAGNLTVQNADFLLVLGCRLSVSSTGHEFHLFSRGAKTMVVDIDETVMQKNTVRIDHFCHALLQDFLPEMQKIAVPDYHPWREKTLRWKRDFPQVPASCADDRNGIDLYWFLESLSQAMTGGKGSAVVSDAGSSFYATTQTIRLDDSQRYITSGGQAEMGFSLPGAIGASAAASGCPIAAISGDGSLQMNIQELQTLAYYRFPVKLFVWNNNGYLSIRATQNKFFQGRKIGTDSSNGVSFPDLEKISDAYGLPYRRLRHSAGLAEELQRILQSDGPVVCEIICNPNQEIIPSISSMKLPDGTMRSLPPEDMYPFLPWEKLQSEMEIPPIPRS